MFTANIFVGVESGSVDDLLKLFSFEDKVFSNDRASYEVGLEKEGLLKIVVSANDGVAFRAVMNSVTKVLGVYDKAKKVVRGNKNE